MWETLNRRVSVDSPLPRWNYKKAKWGLFRHRTSNLIKNWQVKRKDISATLSRNLILVSFRQPMRQSQRVLENITNHIGLINHKNCRMMTAARNLERDGNKLWRLTKQLKDEANAEQKITLD